MTRIIVVKKTAANRKDDQIEKRQELEKRLQDVTGVLGSAAKKSKKGTWALLAVCFHILYSSVYLSPSRVILELVIEF